MMNNDSRFLILWMEFDQVFRRADSRFRMTSLGELSDLLLWFERWGNRHGYCLEEHRSNADAWLELQTEIEGNPSPCEVKLYQPGISNAPAVTVRTDKNGSGTFCVPAGSWELEVTHGPEFCPYQASVQLETSVHSKQKIELERIIDLPKLGWYSAELHHHSIFSSPAYGGTDDVIDTPAQVGLAMQAAGCTFGVLSDHHNSLNHSIWQNQANPGFVPVPGKEISTSCGHVMATGCMQDIAFRIPSGNGRNKDMLKREFRRVIGEIKRSGGLAQLNHPFSESASTSWPAGWEDVLPLFDCIEIWNGAHPMIKGSLNDRSFHLWLDLLKQGHRMAASAGSDTHYPDVTQYQHCISRVSKIIRILEHGSEHLPDSLRCKAAIIVSMWKTSGVYLLEWIRERLGTACVRSYVRLDQAPAPDALLGALKSGRSFLTNGPLLLVRADGAQPGEQRSHWCETFDLSVDIWSRRPPQKLTCYLSDGREVHRNIKQEKAKIHYTTRIKKVPVKQAVWVVCCVEGGCSDLAIANPIYL